MDGLERFIKYRKKIIAFNAVIFSAIFAYLLFMLYLQVNGKVFSQVNSSLGLDELPYFRFIWFIFLAITIPINVRYYEERSKFKNLAESARKINLTLKNRFFWLLVILIILDILFIAFMINEIILNNNEILPADSILYSFLALLPLSTLALAFKLL